MYITETCSTRGVGLGLRYHVHIVRITRAGQKKGKNQCETVCLIDNQGVMIST